MLSKISVKKPFTVLVAVVIIVVFGVVSYTRMTPDLFPKINTPYVIVMTTYPGASPQEAETEITDIMEKQMATLSNIKNITSVSAANYSVIQMEFSDDVNMDAISVDIREKIDQVEGQLPESSETPVVMKISLDMMPVVTAAVGMKGKSSGEVSKFTKEELLNTLEGVEGVASVTSMGMVDDNVQIVLSQEKIDKVNERISSAISAQMGSASGEIESGISAAKNGKKQINSGKKAITEGQKKAAKQISSARSQLTKSKEQLEELKKNGPQLKLLWEAYNNSDPMIKSQAEAGMKVMGLTADQLKTTVAQLDTVDDQIKAVEKAINELDEKSSTASFTLGTQYSDLAAAESTVDATVNQLQSALSQVQDSKEAALASADMTGVLTMDNISSILNAQNFSMPAGYITDGKAEVLVSVGDKIKHKKELSGLILFDPDIDGVDPVKLSDIGTVTYADQSADTYAKINGENGVLLSFTKQSSYATADVSGNIQDKFSQLENKYDDLEFITLSDQGDYIHMVINSVLQNLLLGAALAILILLFFLRDIRPTLITAVSIPVSVLFAVMMMYFSGVTLNMISLSGLAIGVGMLVDNSIVVIENIYRLRALGYSKIQAAFSGAVQVSGAITASTLTTICVFVPIVFVDGMTKDIFLDLALTVAYSLLASLFIALTLVPAMAKGMLVKETKKTVLGSDSRFIAKYRKIAGWSICHKKVLIIGGILILLASSGLALARGFSYMPSMSTTEITATVQMPDESTLKETSETTDKIVDEIKKTGGVKTTGAMLSSNTMSMLSGGAAQQDVTSTMIYVVLEDGKADKGKEISAKLDKLSKKYGCEITTSASMDMSSMMGGNDVELALYSDDLDLLRSTGSSIEKQLGKMKSLEDVSNVDEESSKELKVVVNKNLAMKEGLTVAQVYQQIASKIKKETTATTLKQSDGSVDVMVENSKGKNLTKKELKDMKLSVEKQDGTKSEVSLSRIADIKNGASLDSVNHTDQKRSLKVTAGVRDGYNITHVTDDVKKMISDKKLVPDGVRVEYSGQNEQIADAMTQMMLMLAIGFILVYLIMVAQFQSLRSPFIVIFTIPLAFTGGMLGLLITGKEVSVVSMMGFVMLMGIVVNNAIVLVDCINRFRLEGMEMDEAIINAGAVRMRPVLMTAVTTVLGLLPLAIGLGDGAEMIQPVAVVCIGGLIYGTLTTLVIIPVMYKIFGKKHMEKIKEEELEVVNV